ncbi:hypothetical protein [Ktedonosporobacter rubrisoli]|uniref:hypothetical protein n=1 Tax=Ktedonosporobacter rubrisoli TaxID=2509675 RepID=UPI0013EE44B3|nr:hypothetical protein [Ktedonosporobacter rubrisoli]
MGRDKINALQPSGQKTLLYKTNAIFPTLKGLHEEIQVAAISLWLLSQIEGQASSAGL